ncbi:MAG: hypothetical protein K0R54_5819 [Clostridiaceae bacterium]|nr:hypothetical protein [Clostridiaceae bacterium]
MTNKDDIKLMPLCIPSEWKITWNCFFQISIEDAKRECSWNSYFTEDLLLIKSFDKNIIIDLGWLPDMDLSGQYKLCIYKQEEEEPFIAFESRLYDEISERINNFLGKYKNEEEESVKEKLFPLRIPTGWKIQMNHWRRNLLKVEYNHVTKQETATQIIFHAVKNIYGLVHITVQYLYENSSTFRLTINREDDSYYYKCVEIMEEEVALAVLEQWLKNSYLSDIKLLLP